MREFRRPTDPGVPQDWRRGTIGDVFARVTAKNLNDSPHVLTISAEHGLVDQADYFNRVVASTDRRGYTFIVRGDFAYKKSYSAGYPVGAIRRLDAYDGGALSPLYFCFSLVTPCVDSQYAKHFFEAGMADGGLADIADQGAREHGLLNVGVSEFFGVPFWRPTLPEQRRIAEILDTLDEAIRKTEQVIAKLQQMKKGLLHDLLTRGIDENGDLRDPERHPEQFKDSPLGRIPSEWEVSALGVALRDIRYGTSAPSGDDPAGSPVLRIPNVQAGELDLTDLKYQRPDSHEIRRYGLEADDVLVIRTNGSRELLGRCAFVPDPGAGWMFASYLIRLRIDSSKLVPAFAAEYINGPTSRAYVKQHVVTSAGNYNINTAQLRALPVAAPPLSEQRRLLLVIMEVDERLRGETEELEKYQTLKRGLMDDLLTGRIRVSVPEEAAA